MDKGLEASSTSSKLSKPFRPPFKVPEASKALSASVKNPLFKPLQNLSSIQPVKAPVSEKTEMSNEYYNVFYTKDIKKKTKAFKEGVLEITKGKVRIFDSEGNEAYNVPKGRYFKELPAVDDEYFLGSYLIQIQAKMNNDEFTSGRCFLKGQVHTPQKPNTVKSTLLHKKMKISPKKGEDVGEVHIPEGAYVLVEKKEDRSIFPCYIDPYLGTKMRIHQKEGVKFMFECICGLRGQEITGCILADSMGLGKTLQTIGLIWTLVKQNPYNMKKPFINKVIVLAPLSVVKNWDKEFGKWLGSTRLQPLVAMGEKEDVSKAIENFTQGHYRCLLTSYEVFQKQIEKLNNHCDLIILDEGHRLKNMSNKLFQSFEKFSCKKRIILTGTPLQNKLEELYACCDFINPGIFSNLNTFRKVFITPILAGLKKAAASDAQALARERSRELSTILSSFILRRPASIMENILPPKHEYFVLLNLSEVQKVAYKQILKHKIYKSDNADEGAGDVFSLILVLRKLLNHPQLLANDNSDCGQIGLGSYPENVFQMNLWETSIKFRFTKELMDSMKPTDKLIIVSYFTQTMDLIEKICSASNLKFLRLDGQVAPMKRQRLIDRFNDKGSDIRVFLLCGKAGGTGLNLTGANKMIMFEADWNPSNDHQVMGRIWRDGQKKEAKIYRLISCGTIEEKIIQRQFVKENLSLNVVDEKNAKSLFDTNDLKKIFKFENDTKSIIFAEAENEREELFETNEDFLSTMRNYIPFVKKKTDVAIQDDEDDNGANINEFEGENIFLTSAKKAKKKKKNEGSDNEDKEEDEDSKEDNERENRSKEDDEEECYLKFSDESDNEENKDSEERINKGNSKEEIKGEVSRESDKDEGDEEDSDNESEEGLEEMEKEDEEEEKKQKQLVRREKEIEEENNYEQGKEDFEEVEEKENERKDKAKSKLVSKGKHLIIQDSDDNQKSFEKSEKDINMQIESKPIQNEKGPEKLATLFGLSRQYKVLSTLGIGNKAANSGFPSLLPERKEENTVEGTLNESENKEKESLKRKAQPGEIGQNALKKLKLL